MKRLLEHWGEVAARIKEATRIALFLDYDGTLTPIVETPEKAHLSHKTKDLLVKLYSLSWVELHVISGRRLSEIKRLVGIDGITYIGNHGFEIDGHGLPHDTGKSQRAIRHVLKRLREEAPVRGLLIEDKGITASIHYRMVDEQKLPEVEERLFSIANEYVEKGLLVITHGKKVFELKPNVHWDKGNAVEYLLKNLGGALPIYVGDDETDADAFRMLRKNGITIVVSEKFGYGAEYCLKDVDEVQEMLERLVSMN